MKQPVAWNSAKPDPYLWPHVLVEMSAVRDLCGCRRRAFRSHCNRYESRWGSYYEFVPEPIERSGSDRRTIIQNDDPQRFLFKLYANLKSFTKKVNETTFYQAQQDLMAEFVWLIRPCLHVQAKMHPLQLRPYQNMHPPKHLARTQ